MPPVILVHPSAVAFKFVRPDPSPETDVAVNTPIIFVLPTILNFYSITIDKYGPYLTFLIFIIISSFILPHNFNTIIPSTQQ